MPDFKTSGQNKCRKPPPKHWSNLQDNFTAIHEQNKPTLKTKAQVVQPPKPNEQDPNTNPT